MNYDEETGDDTEAIIIVNTHEIVTSRREIQREKEREREKETNGKKERKTRRQSKKERLNECVENKRNQKTLVKGRSA